MEFKKMISELITLIFHYQQNRYSAILLHHSIVSKGLMYILPQNICVRLGKTPSLGLPFSGKGPGEGLLMKYSPKKS